MTIEEMYAGVLDNYRCDRTAYKLNAALKNFRDPEVEKALAELRRDMRVPWQMMYLRSD